ncbi:MAG TPA: Flp family type IVb pilin [Gemmataceae bacterium]|nr:Flp family type IVb pilin [Gemmataceae bacterium]
MTKFYLAVWRVRAFCADSARTVTRVIRKEEGASLVEYALLVALIAMVCIAAVAVLGTYISNVFTNIKANLTSNNVQ